MPLNNLHPLRIADAVNGVRHVFVHDLLIDAEIGAYEHEKNAPQPIRINVDLSVAETDDDLNDELRNVVCYDSIVTKIRTIVAGGHIHLVETLAEKIADMTLQDRRVLAARVRVEKLAVVADAASVGVEIERHK